MHTLQTTSGALLDALANVLPAIPTKPPVPILAGVRFQIGADGGGGVSLTGYDYELTARTWIAEPEDEDVRETLSDGEPFIVAARSLGSTVRTLCGRRRNDVVRIEVGDQYAKVSANGYTANVGVFPADEYPALPERIDDAEAVFQVDGDQLRRAATRATPTKDETLPILAAARLTLDGGDLRIMSTDRYRVTDERIPVGSISLTDRAVLVRVRTLRAITKRLGGPVMVRIPPATGVHPSKVGIEGTPRIEFQSDDVGYLLTLGDGDYPKLDSLFPDSHPWVVRFNRDQLRERVSIIRRLSEPNQPLRVAFNASQLVASYRDIFDSHKTPPVEVVGYRSDHGPISDYAFNPEYLADVLAATRDDVVDVYGQEQPGKPVTFVAERGQYRYLLMPVRV